MSIAAIRTALEKHLADTPGLPPVAWPNVPFTPSPGHSYIRAEFVPVTRRPIVMGPGPMHRAVGLFMLSVCTPERDGAGAGLALADVLLQRFNGSTTIQSPTVNVSIEYSEAKLPLHSPPFYVIPIQVGWYAYV